MKIGRGFSRLNKPSGLSVVELVIGVVILLIGVAPLLVVVLGTHDRIVSRQAQANSVRDAKNLLTMINNLKWDENTPSAGTYLSLGSASVTLGLDGGEAADRSDADDVDDYHGYSESPEEGVSLVVAVEYVNVVENAQVTVSGSPTDYKRIRITATAKTGKGNLVDIVDSIRANGVVQ